MTALCVNNGPSGIKDPITAASQVIGPSEIVDLLAKRGFGWFGPLAFGVGYLAFDLFNVCATDPPALPTIDAPRILSYVASTQGAQFLREDATLIVQNLLWWEYCSCTTGATPPQPPAPPQPPGTAINNPITPTAPPTHCGAIWSSFEGLNFDASGNITWAFPGPPTAFLPSAQWWDYSINGGFNTTTQAYPVQHTLTFVGSAGAVLDTVSWTQTADILAASPQKQQGQMPPGAVGVQLRSHTQDTTQLGYSMQFALTQHCDTTPTNVLQPCCPPDPTLTILINQVLQLENLILASLPGAKKPYVDSTVHAGLTGNGRISINPASKAIRVDITSRPSSWPSGKTDPSYLFSIGFITPFAVGTALRGSRLVYDHEIYEWQTYTDAVAYALELGVTVQLTELVTQSA